MVLKCLRKQIFPQFECKSNGIVFTLDNMNDRIVLFSSRKCSNHILNIKLSLGEDFQSKLSLILLVAVKNNYMHEMNMQILACLQIDCFNIDISCLKNLSKFYDILRNEFNIPCFQLNLI